MSKKKHSLTVFLGTLFCIALLFAGCGQKSGQSQGESKKEILVGAVGAMTGPSAQLGANLRQGVDLAVEEINAAGGINGRMIKVIYRDDEADPTKSLNAVQELITKEKVVAIIGPVNTTCALAVQPFISQSKIPNINGGCTGTELIDPQKYPYTFRTILNNRDQAEGMVNYAVNDRGWKRVAIVRDTTALGVGGAADMKYFLSRLGLSPVAEVTYTVGEQDLTAQALALKEAKPDVALFWTLGVDGARLMKALQKIDYL
ncbi:MAG: ABC transporter substrate-binding protein [Bacillota bacterium]